MGIDKSKQEKKIYSQLVLFVSETLKVLFILLNNKNEVDLMHKFKSTFSLYNC